jgi:hypothetical protein
VGGSTTPRIPCVDDECDAILRTQLVDEQAERGLEKRQLVLGHHRSGDVDEKHEVVGRQLLDVDGSAAESDAHEPVCRVPGRDGDLRTDRHGVFAAWRRKLVREVVDELLDADGVARWSLTTREETAHVAVGCAIDVDGERRPGCRRRREKRVLVDGVVAFRVECGIGVPAHTARSFILAQCCGD